LSNLVSRLYPVLYFFAPLPMIVFNRTSWFNPFRTDTPTSIHILRTPRTRLTRLSLAAHQSSDERAESSRLEICRKPNHTILLCQADTFIGRGDDEADRNRPFVPGCTAGDRPDQPEPRTRWPVSLRLFSSQLWSYCSGPVKR
jgi:hypothetical protein